MAQPGAGRRARTGRRGGGRVTRPARSRAGSAEAKGERRDLREVSIRSVWVWRGFLLMSLLALGIVLVMAGNHQESLALLWGVIAAGWFAVSMWLWRMHRRLEA